MQLKMKKIVLLVFLVAFSINAENLSLFDANVQLPEGWTVTHRQSGNSADDLIVGLKNIRKPIQIQIGITVNKKPFEEAVAAWKSGAERSAPKRGLTMSDEHYQIVPRGSCKQAILSFRLGKGGIDMFVTSRFWIDKGKEISVAASSMRDVSSDDEVIKIFDSIVL